MLGPKRCEYSSSSFCRPPRAAMFMCLLLLLLFLKGVGVGLALGRWWGKSPGTATTTTTPPPITTAPPPAPLCTAMTSLPPPAPPTLPPLPSRPCSRKASAPAEAEAQGGDRASSSSECEKAPREVYMARHSKVFHTSRRCRAIKNNSGVDGIRVCNFCARGDKLD